MSVHKGGGGQGHSPRGQNCPIEDVQFLILLFIWVVLDLLIPISSMVFINSKGIFLIFFVVIFVEKNSLKLLIRSCGKGGGVSEKSTWF